MKIYLAGRYGRRQQLREVRKSLVDLGYEVTSSWLDTDFEGGVGSAHAPPEMREKIALTNLKDLTRADAVVSFTEEPDSTQGKRGGRHVEFGMAVAMNKRLIVIGHRENVFHHLPQVESYPTIWDLIEKERSC